MRRIRIILHLSTKPVDNVELGPIIDLDLEPTSNTKPTDESTLELEPTFEIGIDSVNTII